MTTTQVTNNLIANNTGNGIYTEYGTCVPSIVNNTIVDNSGAGIMLTSPNSVPVKNNVIAFNGSGGIICDYGQLVLSHNCVYENETNYSEGIEHQTDISVDPLFLSRQHQQYRLLYGSSCINAGNDNAASGIDNDLDGNPRIYSTHVDMGAFEFSMTAIGNVAYVTTGGFAKGGIWNLVSVPADPVIPDPLVVFSAIDVRNSSFQYWKNNVDGGGYQSYGETAGWTGPIVRGIPYWFLHQGTVTEISYDGFTPTEDFILTIPAHSNAPFWVMFGTPFPYPVLADDIRFRNIEKRGDTWLTWEEAFSQQDPTLRIVDSNAQGWDAANNRFIIINPTAFGEEFNRIDPWWGYWLLVYDTHEMQIKFPLP